MKSGAVLVVVASVNVDLMMHNYDNTGQMTTAGWLLVCTVQPTKAFSKR